jgi:DnaK suppressor protein
MKIQAHPDAELSHSQLEELASRLIHTRRELAGMSDTLNRQITSKDDCSVADAAEAASLQESRLSAKSLADHNSETIAEIDVALERITSGRYGVSEMTGEPIPYARLLHIPWARTGTDEHDRTRDRNA